jgi:hypothetical protein
MEFGEGESCLEGFGVGKYYFIIVGVFVCVNGDMVFCLLYSFWIEICLY